MARCSACGTGMTFTESNIALSFGGKCKNCIVRDNPEQKDKLQNKKTKEQLILDADQELIEQEVQLITITTETAPNLNITERIDVISAQAAFEINNFKDVILGIMNPVKGRSNELETQLEELRRKSTLELKSKAHAIGANAVVAVDLDLSTVTIGTISMMMMMASGTAVIVEE